MRLASSPAPSNWTACAYFRNRSFAKTASAPGIWQGVATANLRRGRRPALGLRADSGPEGTELLPRGLENSRECSLYRTRLPHAHAHPFAHQLRLPPCLRSKSGDNSSSSLGDVVTGTRRPTPPASGKSCCQSWVGGDAGGWSPHCLALFSP